MSGTNPIRSDQIFEIPDFKTLVEITMLKLLLDEKVRIASESSKSN